MSSPNKQITDPDIANRDYPVKGAKWKSESDPLRLVLFPSNTHWRIEVSTDFRPDFGIGISGRPPAEALIAAGCLHRGIPTPWAAAKELDTWCADLGLHSDTASRSASMAYEIAAKIVRGEPVLADMDKEHLLA